MATQKTQSDIDYNNSPVAWFCVLEQARLTNDFERAVEAKRELERLGVLVKYRRHIKSSITNKGELICSH